MQKIHCVCPCCGQETFVSVEIFMELEKYALLHGQIVEVLEGEETGDIRDNLMKTKKE